MVQNIDIKDIADGQRKLNALVRDHIGNINGHPMASAFFAGFQSLDDKKESFFMGNRAIGIPAGITKTTDLSFGLYYGNTSVLTDLPNKQEASTVLIKVEGWGALTVTDENNMSSGDSNAALKKISVLIGQTENTRIISSSGAYDSGWLNDEVWTPQTLLNGSKGVVSAIKQKNGLTGFYRVDVEFNLNGNFSSLSDIIQLKAGYVAGSTNIIAFSGWGQTSSGAIRGASFAIHGNQFIEYVPVSTDTLVSLNGYISFVSGSPTS